jgi:hypothetical protein
MAKVEIGSDADYNTDRIVSAIRGFLRMIPGTTPKIPV